MKSNLFLKYFPTPDFLKMPSIGLDISDNSVRFVSFIDYKKTNALGKFGKIDLPKGVVSRGEIKDKSKLVEILKAVKKDFSSNFVRVSIIENNSYIFKTQISKTEDMDYEEMKGLLNFKLEQNVPIKPEEAVFDFDIISETESNFDLAVTVLPKKLVEEFIEVFDEVGLTPLSFEVEAQAVARSVIENKNKRTFMVVDFGEERTGVSIVSDGIVQFTATIDIGGDGLTQSIKKDLNISETEAEKIKKEKGFVKINSDNELFFSMLNTMAVLKDEINKYLAYWHTHKDNIIEGKTIKLVEKIILCGSEGSLKGLDDYLSLGVSLDVEKANVWVNKFKFDDFVPEMDFSESLGYSAAIGLAMKDTDKLLLLGKKVKKK
ncbi:pilus assembly protein PilM [Patescibacteria group bacterium]|nr:pilus assembly protein PilM [Patescibacteria group bacterium]MCG2695163.1 pilus assembly protein PilM [Candidatus Parcubacteria bacterium]